MTNPPENHQRAFIKKLEAHVEAHLSDSNLDVGRLLRLTGMSRTNLHNKLKLAVGVSTTGYVRRVRLARAAQLLLEHPNWTVWAVALEVGFENLGYFTKRFKERYGCSPGAWRERGNLGRKQTSFFI